jgi:hypothetical protein
LDDIVHFSFTFSMKIIIVKVVIAFTIEFGSTLLVFA